MTKRIFIAINLPEELKGKILAWQKKYKKLRFVPSAAKKIGWTKPENLHITLVFIGSLEENKIKKALEAVRAATKNFKPFEININRINLGPNLNSPRMIWLSGPNNKNLSCLARQIESGLKKEGVEIKNSHSFSVHITLARAKNNELQGVKIDEKFDYSFVAKSIDAMESKLVLNGPEYATIESIKMW